MPEDRSRYAARQAELLAALQGRAPAPEKFAPDDLSAASDSLLRKRTRAVAGSWPALAQSFGGRFGPAFASFARETPPPIEGDGLADGLAFALSLPTGSLDEDARTELLLVRATTVLDGRGARTRRGPFAGALRLHSPPRLLLVVTLPPARPRLFAIPLRWMDPR